RSFSSGWCEHRRVSPSPFQETLFFEEFVWNVVLELRVRIPSRAADVKHGSENFAQESSRASQRPSGGSPRDARGLRLAILLATNHVPQLAPANSTQIDASRITRSELKSVSNHLIGFDADAGPLVVSLAHQPRRQVDRHANSGEVELAVCA